MDLNTYRFDFGSTTTHFSVPSSTVCHACYLESIGVPFEEGQIDVDVFKPSHGRQWIVIMHHKAEYTGSMWFFREGDSFVKCASHAMPNEVIAEILHKFPQLAEEPYTKAA